MTDLGRQSRPRASFVQRARCFPESRSPFDPTGDVIGVPRMTVLCSMYTPRAPHIYVKRGDEYEPFACLDPLRFASMWPGLSCSNTVFVG